MSQQKSQSQWVVGLAVVLLVGLVIGAVLLIKPSDRSPLPVNKPALTVEQMVQKFEPLRQQFMQQRGKADLGQLISQVHKLAGKYPTFAPGQLFLGQLYFDQGDLENAQLYISKCLELDPKQGQVHLLAGNIALMQQDAQGAIDHLSQAVALEPSNAKYWLYLGQSYFTQKIWPQAQQCFEKTIELDSAMTLAYSGLSDCQVQQGNLCGAVFTLQRAIDQTPLSKRKQQVVFLRKQAMLLGQLNKPSEALLVMGKLTNVEEAEPAVLNEKATYWNQLGEPGKAAELYEAQLKLNLRNWGHAATAARWRIRAGDTAKAQQHILHLQLINPDLPVIAELEKELKQVD